MEINPHYHSTMLNIFTFSGSKTGPAFVKYKGNVNKNSPLFQFYLFLFIYSLFSVNIKAGLVCIFTENIPNFK